MGVQVDEPGQHERSLGIDDPGGPGGPLVLLDGQVGGSHHGDRLDPVTLDDDVGRTHRGRAGPVDHVDAADDQPVERALPLIGPAVRRPVDLRRQPGGGSQQQGGHEEQEASQAMHGILR